MHDDNRRLAVLIDADNVPTTIIHRIFADLVRFGQPVVRRAYGSFHGPLGAGWEEVLARHAIMPRHQTSFGKGKNAADIALVVDAMDLLHGGELDAFVIASCDSDIAPLAIRIREQRLDCYGYGSLKTPERLRSAYTRFVLLENLKFDPLSAEANPNLKPLRPKTDALAIIKTVIAHLAMPGEWVDLYVLERELERRTTDFDPRTFGCVRLVDLLVELKPIVVDRSRRTTPRVRLRMKKVRNQVLRSSPSTISSDSRATAEVEPNVETGADQVAANRAKLHR